MIPTLARTAQTISLLSRSLSSLATNYRRSHQTLQPIVRICRHRFFLTPLPCSVVLNPRQIIVNIDTTTTTTTTSSQPRPSNGQGAQVRLQREELESEEKRTCHPFHPHHRQQEIVERITCTYLLLLLLQSTGPPTSQGHRGRWSCTLDLNVFATILPLRHHSRRLWSQNNLWPRHPILRNRYTP
jgi:hypothetical protein